MTRETDFVQWAQDAEADCEYTRAAEFWGRAHDENPLIEYIAAYRRCDGMARVPKVVHRTGRRTIRGEAAQGVIIMEFSPPNLITFREKGRRKRYPSTLAALFAFAQRTEARRVQDERIKARKLKKLNKGKQ